jgi:DNA-binding MarR family transcriptional regulator
MDKSTEDTASPDPDAHSTAGARTILAPNDWSVAVPSERSVTEAEKLAEARLGGIPLRREQMAVVANIYRAASAVRQHLENSVLREADLTWTAFVVLWVIWIWGESETRNVAEEAGISKGTLTGVARTLETRGLVSRSSHPSDGRLVLLDLTPEGRALMERVFPAFNEEEAFVTSRLSDEECRRTADGLREVVLQVEQHGEERRLALLDGQTPAPRRSGRRPKRA